MQVVKLLERDRLHAAQRSGSLFFAGLLLLPQPNIQHATATGAIAVAEFDVVGGADGLAVDPHAAGAHVQLIVAAGSGRRAVDRDLAGERSLFDAAEVGPHYVERSVEDPLRSRG